jgi:hypothetical protein
MRRRYITRSCTVGVIALGCLALGTSVASATKPDPTHKITICHATASESNPYVTITVDVASIVGDSGHGHSGINAGDIIPPFDIAGNVYAGNNWDAAHEAILDNGCSGSAVDTTTTSITIPV